MLSLLSVSGIVGLSHMTLYLQPLDEAFITTTDTMTSVKVNDLSRTHRGNYKVVVSNELGEASASVSDPTLCTTSGYLILP